MAGGLGVCLVWAATAVAPVSPAQPGVAFIPGAAFTLAWTHSIEKQRWEEDYAVQAGPGGAAPRLVALAARVKGSAAGMEPPPGAVLRDGWYRYAPQIASPEHLNLSRSEFVPDYELCTAEGCRPLVHWLPSDGSVTQLSACRSSDSP